MNCVRFFYLNYLFYFYLNYIFSKTENSVMNSNVFNEVYFNFPPGARNLMGSQYLSRPTDTRAQDTNNTEPPRGTPGDKVIVVL